MTAPLRSLSLLFLALLSVASTEGARIPEDRGEATHVVVGRVTTVFKSVGKEYTGYVVRLRIEGVEKGKGLKEGCFFYAECFSRHPHKGPGLPKPGAKGHAGVPKVGERVRVHVNEDNGIFEGVYPDWFDVLRRKDEG